MKLPESLKTFRNLGLGLCLAVSSQVSLAKDSVNNVVCENDGNKTVCVIKKLEDDDSFPNWKLVFQNGNNNIDPNKFTIMNGCVYYDGKKVFCKR